MKRIVTGKIGIQNGSRVMFADFANGGPMWTGQGNRESRQWIDLEAGFIAPPVVTVSISMWDIDNHQNARADISAENVTAAGFDLVFRTWADTRVARIRADWVAFGPLRDEDEWELY